MLFITAWRNIWRNPRRTILTAGAIMFTCAILAFMVSLQQSSYAAAIRAATSIYQGAFQVQRRGYQENPQSYLTILRPEQVRNDLLERVRGIGEAGVRAEVFALVSSTEKSSGVQITGVEAEREPKLSTLTGTIRKGRYLNHDDQNVAVIGETLARKLRITIGDELTVLGQGADGSMAATILQIVGVFESGSPLLDGNLIQIPLATLQENFTLPDQAHRIVVQGEQFNHLTEDQRELDGWLQSAAYRELEILSWEDLNPGLRESIELDLISGWLFFLSLIVIVAFGVLNTFLMSLLERKREFGLLLSLGMKGDKIVLLTLLEAIGLITIGIIPGVLIGGGVILYFHQNGLRIPGSEEINKLWNLPVTLYPELSLSYLMVGPIVVIAVTLLLVIPFSLRLRRLEPVEALGSAL
ncbi:MAG: ABC transporter permease [Bdellovibrionota bacterium]